MFQLHERLAADTVRLGQFPLCEVLLMKDAHYPWVILVPRRANISEIHQLSTEDQQQLIQESVFLAQAMQAEFSADKMNTAALGNMVPQLHIHHIARFKTDIAWPKPVWGFAEAKAYTGDVLDTVCLRLRRVLAQQLCSEKS